MTGISPAIFGKDSRGEMDDENEQIAGKKPLNSRNKLEFAMDKLY